MFIMACHALTAIHASMRIEAHLLTSGPRHRPSGDRRRRTLCKARLTIPARTLRSMGFTETIEHVDLIKSVHVRVNYVSVRRAV